MQSKFAAAAGRLAGTISAGLGRSATAALRVTESFDGPSLDSLGAVPVALEAGALLASLRSRRPQKLPPMTVPPELKKSVKDEPQELPAWAARFQDRRRADPGEAGTARSRGNRSGSSVADRTAGQARRRAIMVIGLLKLGQATSGFAGTGLARLSRRREPGITAGLQQQFFFPDSTRRPVRLWPSRLTPLFNRADAGLSSLQRSEGLMVEWQGRSWHRGAIVVETAQGERTITHLQSLAVPSTHYYFDRRLSDNETVGIITGQKGFEPKMMDGYAGQVSEVESLFPAWAQLKRDLIQAHLRWGEPGRGAEKQSHRETSHGGQGAEAPGSEAIHPLDGVKAQVSLNGQAYPVLVRRVVNGPDGRALADATYYDEAAGAWQVVEDDTARARLAEQVQSGRIEPWEGMEVSQ